jgi:hypothetical protein
LTCVLIFRIMNKTRTLAGELQSSLSVYGAAHPGAAVGFHGVRAQKGEGDVEA